MLQKEMWPIDHDLAFCSGAETSTALNSPPTECMLVDLASTPRGQIWMGMC